MLMNYRISIFNYYIRTNQASQRLAIKRTPTIILILWISRRRRVSIDLICRFESICSLI